MLIGVHTYKSSDRVKGYAYLACCPRNVGSKLSILAQTQSTPNKKLQTSAEQQPENDADKPPKNVVRKADGVPIVGGCRWTRRASRIIGQEFYGHSIG